MLATTDPPPFSLKTMRPPQKSPPPTPDDKGPSLVMHSLKIPQRCNGTYSYSDWSDALYALNLKEINLFSFSKCLGK